MPAGAVDELAELVDPQVAATGQRLAALGIGHRDPAFAIHRYIQVAPGGVDRAVAEIHAGVVHAGKYPRRAGSAAVHVGAGGGDKIAPEPRGGRVRQIVRIEGLGEHRFARSRGRHVD